MFNEANLRRGHPGSRRQQAVLTEEPRLLRGVPLIAYTIHAERSLDGVFVSTEDPEIGEVSRAWGADVIERPAELARDTSPIDEALRHALDACRRARALAPDVVVWLQADVPIRPAGLIDRAVGMLLGDPQASAVANGFRVSQHPAWMKRLDDDGYLEPADASVTTFRLQELLPLYLLEGAVVAMRAENLLAECAGRTGLHRYLGKRPRLLLQCDAMYSLNIETPDQIELAEFYLERHPEHRVEAATTRAGGQP